MKTVPIPFLLLTLCLFGFSVPAPAAVSPTENGGRLLQAELPRNVDLQSVDCEQLAAAVGRATLAHQPDAPAILRVALMRGVKPLRRGEEGKLSCTCAKRVLGISVAAAPTQASALFDTATELYPGCEGTFAEVLRDYDRVAYDYKDRAGDKNVVDPKDAPARGTTDAPSFDPAHATPSVDDPGTDIQTRGDLSDQDIAGMGFGDINGFGTGFSTGFPGSPGFVGSPPDGGLALPPTALTAAVNG